MPDILSDDEEDRFVKRDDLDERALYFLESLTRPRRYDKSEVWESREAFWMTFEVSQASASSISRVMVDIGQNFA